HRFPPYKRDSSSASRSTGRDCRMQGTESRRPQPASLWRESCSARARSASSASQRPEAPSKARKFVGELANVLGLALECPGSVINRQSVRTARGEEIVRGRAQCPAGKVYPLCCSDDSGISHC